MLSWLFFREIIDENKWSIVVRKGMWMGAQHYLPPHFPISWYWYSHGGLTVWFAESYRSKRKKWSLQVGMLRASHELTTCKSTLKGHPNYPPEWESISLSHARTKGIKNRFKRMDENWETHLRYSNDQEIT